MVSPTQLIFTLFILVSSSSLSANTSAGEPTKTLTLTVEFSRLFGKDMPKLTLSGGPLYEDEASVGVAIKMNQLLNYFAHYKAVKHSNGYFHESRNFRNGQVEFRFKHIDGTLTTRIFHLDPEASSEGIVELPELLANIPMGVDARITGLVDVYICVSNDECLFEETRLEEVRKDLLGGPYVKQNSRLLVHCQPNVAYIEGGIDHPESQRIILHPAVARLMKLERVIVAKGVPVQSGAEFKGFVANLDHFGAQGDQNSGKRLVVRYQDHVINLVVLTHGQDGDQVHQNYSIEGCVNYP